MPKYHAALPPLSVNIWIEGKPVACLALPDQASVRALLTKFAERLKNVSERVELAHRVSHLPDPLQHFWAAAGAEWRVSFSGALGEGAGALVEGISDV